MAEPVDHEAWTDIEAIKSHLVMASAWADRLEKEHVVLRSDPFRTASYYWAVACRSAVPSVFPPKLGV